MKKMTTKLITMASAAMITAAAMNPLTALAEEVERTESTDTKTETSVDPAPVTEVEGDTTTTTDAGPVVTTTTTQTETTVDVTGEDHSKPETATHAEFAYSETEDATISETEKVLEDAVSEQIDVSVESSETEDGTVTTTTITTKEKGAVTEKTTIETSGESKILTHVDEEITDESQKSNITAGKANVQDSDSVNPADYNVVENKTTTTKIKIQGDVRVKEATLDDGSTVSDGTLTDGTTISNGQVTLLEDTDKNATYVAGEKVTAANNTSVQSAAYRAVRNEDGTLKLDENGNPVTADITDENGKFALTNPLADGENLANPMNRATYVAGEKIYNPFKNRDEAGTGGYIYTGERRFDPSIGSQFDRNLEDGEKTDLEKREDVVAKDPDSGREIRCATAYTRGSWTVNEDGSKSFNYVILTNSDLEGDITGNMKTGDGDQVVLDTTGSESQETEKFTSVSGQMALTIADEIWTKLNELIGKTWAYCGKGITTDGLLPKIFFLVSQAEDGTWRTTGETATAETAKANGGHYFVPYVLKLEADTFWGPYQAGYHYDGYLYFLNAEVEQTRNVVISQDVMRTVTEQKTVVTTQDESESVWTQTVLNRRTPENPEEPADPTEPETPEQPSEPENPVTPDPEQPSEPTAPSNPSLDQPTAPSQHIPGTVLESEMPEESRQVLTPNEQLVLGAERALEQGGATESKHVGEAMAVRRVMTGDVGIMTEAGIVAILSLAALWFWSLIEKRR